MPQCFCCIPYCSPHLNHHITIFFHLRIHFCDVFLNFLKIISYTIYDYLWSVSLYHSFFFCLFFLPNHLYSVMVSKLVFRPIFQYGVFFYSSLFFSDLLTCYIQLIYYLEFCKEQEKNKTNLLFKHKLTTTIHVNSIPSEIWEEVWTAHLMSLRSELSSDLWAQYTRRGVSYPPLFNYDQLLDNTLIQKFFTSYGVFLYF